MNPFVMISMIFMNLIVGACVGLTGIAGFLLPMFYTGFLNLPSSEALALSFSAFLVSGALGSFNYHRAGNLDLRSGLILSIGSLAGALLGVRINLLIPEETIKIILYLVVLLSGISILLRKEKPAGSAAGPKPEVCAATTTSAAAKRESSPSAAASRNPRRSLLYVLLGFVTGAICAASGAGGPVLVMPLLTVIGFPVHTAIGVSLFNSIFIAAVAASGYLLHAGFGRELWMLLPALLIAHGIGVFFGSRNAASINQKLLKRIVAVASVVIALVKLIL